MEEAIKIWKEGNVPFNSGRSKLEDMDVHEEYDMMDLMIRHNGIFNMQAAVVEDMSGNDTQTYRNEILNENSPAGLTYEDEPILIPHLVPGSDKCIICCPGGGYLDKSMEGEGEDIAEFLNQAGLSCFVLWYRSNPYKSPVMFRDCQRAVRYVRYHAADYGIDPDKIGIMGFSAGGNLCGTTVEIFRDTQVEDPAYHPDEIDAVSAKVKAMGLIYAVLDFSESTAMLSAVEDREAMRQPEVLRQKAEYYTVRNHIQPGDPATFLCCAMDDMIVPCSQTIRYALALKQAGIPFEMHVFQEGGHGFGGCREKKDALIPRDDSRVAAWKELFVTWVLKELDRSEPYDPMAAYKRFM